MAGSRVRKTWRGATALLIGAGASAFAAGAGPADPAIDPDAPDYCLPVRGSAADDDPALRLAPPPLIDLNAAGGTALYFDRLLRGGAAAPPGGAAPPLMQTAPPLARLLTEGGTHLLAGRQADAERAWTQCIDGAAREKHSLAEAGCTGNLALSHAARGDLAKARVGLMRALSLYRQPRDTPANLPVPPGMAQILGAQSTLIEQQLAALDRLPPQLRAQVEPQIRAAVAAAREQTAASQPQVQAAVAQAWREQERIDTARGIERTLLNLGNLALAAGQRADAQTWLKQAVESHAPGTGAQCKAAAVTDLARLYRRLGRDAESRDLIAQLGPARTSGAEASEVSLVELGVVRLAANATGATPTRMAAAPAPSSAPAMDVLGAPVPFTFGEPGGRLDGDALARLLDTASTAPPAQAADAWRRLLLRADAAQRPDLAFRAHAALMRLHTTRGEGAVAVLHGKQAANLAQATRAALGDASPSRDARRAFLRERRSLYVELAQQLLDQQRLAEAEEVLQLLKEDEGQQFVEGPAVPALGMLTLTSAEQAVVRGTDDAARRLQQGEQARVAAVGRLPMGAGAMLMMDAARLEAARLRLGLALGDLAATVKREPLTAPGRDERSRAMVLELQDFFLGPGQRLERFLAHLIEDAPRFASPASAEQRARLAEYQQRLGQIRAELAPLLRTIAAEDGANVRVTTRAPGQAAPEEPLSAWSYVAAEATEALWRSGRAGDEIESRQLRTDTAAALQAATARAASAPVTAPDGDTRTLMAGQTVPTALLYYLPGEQRVDALLVSGAGRRHVRLAIAQADLDTDLDAFAAALRQPARDPRPAAAALYRRLFAPIEPAVAASGARVLALSLSGRLRAVPFAALHDGRGWLAERYAIALHPGGRLTGRLRAASPDWRAAAFGASQGAGEFPPLPNVRSELLSVVRQRAADPGTLPGEVWLDRDFTADRLRRALAGGAQVLHIASHFKFVAGDAAASYLLLGDGGRLSLKDLAGRDYRFDRTELVTLSACATGLSADDTYGQEVDGLAALLMGQGAPAVLASLWEVNDRSTATLMASMYRLREGQMLSRVLALQQAQLAMIRADGAAEAGSRGVARVRLPGDPEPEPAPPAEASLGQAHPFHWAAFVLMGNWL